MSDDFRFWQILPRFWSPLLHLSTFFLLYTTNIFTLWINHLTITPFHYRTAEGEEEYFFWCTFDAQVLKCSFSCVKPNWNYCFYVLSWKMSFYICWVEWKKCFYGWSFFIHVSRPVKKVFFRVSSRVKTFFKVETFFFFMYSTELKNVFMGELFFFMDHYQ